MANEEKIKIKLEQDTPKQYRAQLNNIQNESDFISRTKDAGLMDNNNKSSIVIKNGQINSSASKYAYQKIGDKTGQIVTSSFEHVEMTNRKRIYTDEIIVNDHKFNSQIWQLSDFKIAGNSMYNNVIIGDLTFDGAVLTKAWDAMLQKYVLMRIPYRGRFFGRKTNVPEINAGLNISDPSLILTKYVSKQSTQSVSDWYKNLVSTVQANGSTTTSQNSDGSTTQTTVNKSDDGNTIVTVYITKNKDGNIITTEKKTEVIENGIIKTTVEIYDTNNNLIKKEGPIESKVQVSGSKIASYTISYVDGGKKYALFTVAYIKLTDSTDKIHRQIRLNENCQEVGIIHNDDTDLNKDIDYKNDVNTYYAYAQNTYANLKVSIDKDG